MGYMLTHVVNLVNCCSSHENCFLAYRYMMELSLERGGEAFITDSTGSYLKIVTLSSMRKMRSRMTLLRLYCLLFMVVFITSFS